MLSQAKPLVELLPEGMLREQLIPEFARLGGVSPETWMAHWSRTGARSGGPGAGQRKAAIPIPAPRVQRTPPKTATQLDRAVWLALRHSDLWLRLSHADHDLLAGQPEPHGPLFAAIDKVLHEHGPLAMDAVIAEVQALHGDGTAAALLARVGGFHDVASDEAAAAKVEFDAVLRFLWTEAVKDELNKLAAEAPSPQASERQRVLYEQLRQLKSAPAPAPPAQAL
jgi:DNA primase